MSINDNPAPYKGDFTVTKTNPSGNIVRFAITDAANLLTTTKMIRAVLHDALEQFVVAERADLITNGDQLVVDKVEQPTTHSGDLPVAYDWPNKRCDLTLTALTSIAATGTITASKPYADVL